PDLAAAVADAAHSVFPEAALIGPPAGCLEAAARTAGLEFVAEGFADRRYLPDGSLVPRSEPDAVIENPDEAVAQALDIARESSVRTRNGPRICLPAKTLCVHGDGPASVALLRSLRKALESNGFTIGR
ncbi:MAG: LamB/YcsF family protein, partial [Verrucomicrobiae bacterium]|nr:LamB/YcsF family protein [Verrucomicrobiae bacterium]